MVYIYLLDIVEVVSKKPLHVPSSHLFPLPSCVFGLFVTCSFFSSVGSNNFTFHFTLFCYFSLLASFLLISTQAQLAGMTDSMFFAIVKSKVNSILLSLEIN